MTTPVEQLWRYVDEHRGTASMPEVLASALATQTDIEITPALLDEVSKRFGSGFSGSYLSSAGLSSFIAELAATKDPQTLLDPTCGSGLLLKTVADRVHAFSVHGIEISRTIVPIAERLLGNSASVFCGDALYSTLPVLDSYDLIISEPPLGLTSGRPLTLAGLDKDLRGDFSDLLICWMSTKLASHGMGIIIMPSSFIWSRRSGQAREAIEALGCAVTGCFQIPSGSLQGTTIEAYVVVIERGSQEDLFVGQYTKDVSHQRVLASNFAARKAGKSPAQGRLCSWEDFRGYSSVEASARIERLVRRVGFDPVPMSTLVIEATRPNKKSFERLEPQPNSVYLPLAGRGRSTTSQDSLSDRLKDYIQLQLDPQLADARFVAHLLNRELGQAILDTARAGTTIERVRPSDLLASTFYLPSLKIQTKVLASLDQLTGIRGEIDELEAAVWTDTRKIDQLSHQVETVNREDRFVDWIDTLPFPLGTILWRYKATEISVQGKVEILLHFFEALAEFIATVHLSAFSSDSEIWSEHSRELFNTLDEQHLSLERGTFGSWKCIAEYLGAKCRRLVSEAPDVAFFLYNTHNPATLRMLASSTLLSVLQHANSMRNDLRHGGAIGEQQAERVHSELTSLVQQCRSVMGRLWLDYELLQPGTARFSGGIAHYSARRLMGTRTPFETVECDSVDQMDDRFLYLFDPNGDRALRVLPFVRMMASPRTEQNACYFFNRVQDGQCRYVSYYFDTDSDLIDNGLDTMEAIAQLMVTATSNKQARNE